MTSLADFITNQIGVQGIWFALVLLLGWKYDSMIKETTQNAKEEIKLERQEGKEREERLIKELEKSQELLTTMADKYDLIISDLKDIKNEIKKGDVQK